MPRLKNSDFVIAGGWLLLAASLLSSPVLSLVHAAIRPFTEGNSPAKSLVLLFFVVLGLSLNRFSSFKPDRRVLNALAIVVFFGFFYGAVLNAIFIFGNGFSINSHLSHVADCGSSWCWEADYLQHNHVSKTAIFFVEKTTGISLGTSVDDGKPMHDVVPWADTAAPLTLFFAGLAGLLGLAAVAAEKDFSKAFFIAAASFLSLLAMIDGGIFTPAGVSAITLLSIVLLFGKQYGAKAKLFVPILAAFFIAFLPNLFGSYLVFTSWFSPVLLASTLFAFIEEGSGWKRLTLLVVFLFAAWHYSSLVLDSSQTGIFRASTINPELPSSPTLVVYGLSPSSSSAEIISQMPELEFSKAAKYGWYFAGYVSDKKSEITTLELQDRLRSAFPRGYLYVDMNRNSQEFRKVRIFWKKTPTSQPSYDLISYKVFSVSEQCGFTELSGVTTASGPALALEVGSYVKSLGGDALVETLTV